MTAEIHQHISEAEIVALEMEPRPYEMDPVNRTLIQKKIDSCSICRKKFKAATDDLHNRFSDSHQVTDDLNRLKIKD